MEAATINTSMYRSCAIVEHQRSNLIVVSGAGAMHRMDMNEWENFASKHHCARAAVFEMMMEHGWTLLSSVCDSHVHSTEYIFGHILPNHQPPILAEHFIERPIDSGVVTTVTTAGNANTRRGFFRRR